MPTLSLEVDPQMRQKIRGLPTAQVASYEYPKATRGNTQKDVNAEMPFRTCEFNRPFFCVTNGTKPSFGGLASSQRREYLG